ncbi:IMPACT family protein [Mycoplasma bradburyae]|uniref:YigZ family protein n=1 Tax=Mycoplasma bradburyae TaxID=2963128 RepID=A0ABT5GBW0_9MOLU|nr:YigZ family protein [Mycoplasma bradburyae]MDC4182294.1 YigZ family protein [Mycoplasma bradburyae]MDC4182789.1 YigZ family protein [Mycoplasma bradburyae]MDC4184468.1 YigZ family protein [Mycoplasma bradburyae]UTS69800.1 YigZ family protein [Mycoplasma bradburyae]
MVELIFKNSRFIGIYYQISSKDEIKKHLDNLRKEYKKARHICYGYLFKDNGVESGGYNDDGEPKNTAGKPIYDLLRTKELYGYVVFVVRYFGGIKLGAGGLIKAYRKTAIATVDLISA